MNYGQWINHMMWKNFAFGGNSLFKYLGLFDLLLFQRTKKVCLLGDSKRLLTIRAELFSINCRLNSALLWTLFS